MVSINQTLGVMTYKKFTYRLVIRDDNNVVVPTDELADSTIETIVDNILMGDTDGEVFQHDDSDEWAEINKGEEKFERDNNK